jgi:uncharacterized membrane protein YphA (DoxX/SURF4 family)
MGFPAMPLDPVLPHALAGAAALVLLVGAAHKFRAWDAFRAAVAAYRLLPEALVVPAALALPALELIAGAALLAGPFRSAGALLALALLATVTAAVAINLGRGRADIDCGCGGAEGRQRLSWGLVARNMLLMGAVAVGVAEGAPRALGALDDTTTVFASLALYGLYACASQLLANRPRLTELRNQ